MPTSRRYGVGAECSRTGDGRVHFRVWAPSASRVDVVFENGRQHPLDQEPGGYFSCVVPARPGEDYRFRLNEADRALPDPASRWQPSGPHGPSRIVDPASFQWTDERWEGVGAEGQVLYEMHVGTFTTEGTWAAAARHLEWLADVGVTIVEMMPVAEFEGRFGWGYDGVCMFAPFHGYGSPDDLRQFVDRAHQAGIGVILDVVYNHLGPVGNYLREFSPAYFTDRYENEWGDALNFDGPDAGPVREYFIDNAGYWIDEFHMDGLRLDATQQIFDASPENVMALVGRRVRETASPRSTYIVAENEPQDTRLVRPVEQKGYALDALWNDDFHHSAMVALTGRAEAYYSDTRGTAQEFVSAAKYGYLYQGQYYDWQLQPRGTPALDLAPARFVAFLQNHDQVANSATGRRGHTQTAPGKWRAMTALLLLMPSTPMLFQGQEFASSAPFLYFADFEPELAEAVRNGRAEFLAQFPSISGFEKEGRLDDPSNPETFARSKLDDSEREGHHEAVALHRDLLRLRRETAAFRRQAKGGMDGAVLSSDVFVLRFFAEKWDDERLVVVNLGADYLQPSVAEPLAAPPAGCVWHLDWSSEHSRYGGGGVCDVFPSGRWRVPAESAHVFAPVESNEPRPRRVRRRTA